MEIKTAPRKLSTRPLKAPKLLRADTIEPQQAHWLWYPYIPAKSSSMLFGPGGVGKSYLTCAIAAAVTTGTPLPGQSRGVRPQKVLMLSAEDDLNVVIRPRLDLVGADLSRIYIPSEPFVLDKKGLKDMAQYMKKTAATVVFIDPIVHYMGGQIDMHRMNEVRGIMGALQQLAKETGTAMVIVHHSRKGSDGHGYERASGSADFVNATRSSILCGKTNDGGTVMAHVKNNYGPIGDAICYNAGNDGFTWGDFADKDVLEFVDHSQGRPPKAKGRASAFLETMLRDGPVPSEELYASAKDEGLAKRTVDRAKKGLAESYVDRASGKTVWWTRLIADRPVMDEGQGIT